MVRRLVSGKNVHFCSLHLGYMPTKIQMSVIDLFESHFLAVFKNNNNKNNAKEFTSKHWYPVQNVLWGNLKYQKPLKIHEHILSQPPSIQKMNCWTLHLGDLCVKYKHMHSIYHPWINLSHCHRSREELIANIKVCKQVHLWVPREWSIFTSERKWAAQIMLEQYQWNVEFKNPTWTKENNLMKVC